MNKLVFRAIFIGLCLFALSLTANAQDKKKNAAEKTLGTTKKVVFVVVGQSAKLSYKTTKFAAKHVAKPIIVKSAPKVTKFMLKQTGKTLKKSLPVAKTVLIKYLKYKFLP